MSNDYAINQRARRMAPAYRADPGAVGADEGRLPKGAIGETEKAVERFWAKRGRKEPSERYLSKGMVRGERGVA